jgi:hypothetical protein
MKQGSKGEDFAKELWNEGLVGVLFGTWSIEHVLDEGGKPDPAKLTARAIEEQCPQPKGIGFNDRFLNAPRTFLLKVALNDGVVVTFDKALHLGTIGEGFGPDPDPPRGEYDEHFKCRPVHTQKTFPLADLPASYRLVPATGRSALQRIERYKQLTRLLDEHDDARGVKQALTHLPTREFLGMISDKQWEVLCNEYLRDKVGLRSLLLAVGGSLEDVDICGVDRDGARVLVQCKNDPKPWSREQVERWVKEVPSSPEDRLQFFIQGGVEGWDHDLGCRVVDGEEIAQWLDENQTYLRQVKIL